MTNPTTSAQDRVPLAARWAVFLPDSEVWKWKQDTRKDRIKRVLWCRRLHSWRLGAFNRSVCPSCAVSFVRNVAR